MNNYTNVKALAEEQGIRFMSHSWPLLFIFFSLFITALFGKKRMRKTESERKKKEAVWMVRECEGSRGDSKL